MSYIRWKGDAKAVAQVRTYTPATITAGNIFTLTCNGKTISFTSAGTTAAAIVAGLTALLAATDGSVPPEFKKVTVSGTTTLILTATNAGEPFTITSSAATGTGTPTPTFVAASTVASAGPNHVDDVTNYSGGALPVNGDTLEVADTSVSMFWGLDQLAAVTLAALYVRRTYSGQIGLPRINASGATPFTEYRADYFQMPATITDVDTTNCPLAKIDSLAVQATVTVRGTGGGSASVDGGYGFIWKGTHTSNAWVQQAGNTAAAPFGNESAAINSFKVEGGSFTGGTGLALQSGGTFLWASSGLCVLNAAPCLSPTIAAGTVQQNEGNVTSPLVYDGATYDYRGAGTVTTPALQPGATMRFDGDPRSRAISGTVPIYTRTRWLDPKKPTGSVTMTRPDGQLGDGETIQMGPGRTYAVS